jgi:predicted ATPase/DNA-binding CsgD family transcriptional regulator
MQDVAQQSLSARQVEIAKLVVAGKSNREIAEVLHLSPRTVEHHLEAIFNKLGVRSRVELTAALVGPTRNASAGSMAQPAPNNLPVQRTRLIGRKAEIDEIVGFLGVSRLVTVTGSGGVGKTRTALAVGHAHLQDLAAGVWFVDLAPLSPGPFLEAAIARVLGVKESSKRPLLETLVAFLKPQSAVLMLDNCEHLIAEAAVVAGALLGGCPNVRILATSREPLRIAGEQTYRLPSLPVPTAAEAVKLTAMRAADFAAVELFAQAARAIDRGFALSDDNAGIVAEICRRLDGIPLAIELAASRVNILPVRALSQKLDQRFAILTGGDRTALARHQTMRALIDWSHDLLDARERTLFRRLGIFVNGFTLDGAVGVACGGDLAQDDVFAALASLVDKSLVFTETHGEAVRYRMLESTRAYACEKLEAAGELRESVTRRLYYLLDIFKAAKIQADRTANAQGMFNLLVAELEDVRATIAAITSSGEVELCAELLEAIATQWDRLGIASEGAAYLERIFSLLPPHVPRLKAALALTSAYLFYGSDHVRGRETSFVALGLAREANDPHTLSRALHVYAIYSVKAGEFDDAAAALAEAEVLTLAWDAAMRDNIITMKAMLNAETGDFDAAAKACDELRTRRLELGNLSGAYHATVNLADIEHLRGQTEKAAALLQEVVPALRAGPDRYRFLWSVANLSTCLVALDRLPEARDVVYDALQHVAVADYDLHVTFVVIEVSALIVARWGNVRCGGQLAGCAGAGYDRTGFRLGVTEKSTRNRLEAVLGEGLEPSELRKLRAVGAALAPQDAVALALAALEEMPADNGPSLG